MHFFVGRRIVTSAQDDSLKSAQLRCRRQIRKHDVLETNPARFEIRPKGPEWIARVADDENAERHVESPVPQNVVATSTLPYIFNSGTIQTRMIVMRNQRRWLVNNQGESHARSAF